MRAGTGDLCRHVSIAKHNHTCAQPCATDTPLACAQPEKAQAEGASLRTRSGLKSPASIFASRSGIWVAACW